MMASSAPIDDQPHEDDDSAAGAGSTQPIAQAPSPALPAHLTRLTERARDYIDAASSANTRRAYASDWKHFSSWCRRQGLELLPPSPQVVGLYITACASGAAVPCGKPNTVSTIERRLSAIGWNYTQRGTPLDRSDRHIATVLAGIRNTHGAPPRQKEAGWIEILDKGLLVTLRGKNGWREIEVGRGSSDATCPVVALETWLRLAKIGHGPLFRRVTGRGRDVGPDRLNDREVARLVKRTALAAGVRGDLTEGEREEKFAGHSLRAGLASSAEVDERHVQKQLGHASAEMTRRYQRRRDRFRVNLTKAAGL
ncbi:MAG: integrase [Rhizobiales bacterium 32-66-11]|nr:MAG: integrase [Rhizobiales bacterium 32-66-11]